MVKLLTPADNLAIQQAVHEAEKRIHAELAVVVAPVSHHYQSHILFCGFVAGSVLAAGLWAMQLLTSFPPLLGVQAAVMALISQVPWLQHLCLRLIPARILCHYASQQAVHEYVLLSHHAPKDIPVLLLFISTGARYAHILVNRVVREKIPDTIWDAVIQQFTANISNLGLRQATLNAIQKSTELLLPHFPHNEG